MHPIDIRPYHIPKRFWRSRQCELLFNRLKSTATAALKADRRVLWLASFGIAVDLLWKKREVEFAIRTKRAVNATTRRRQEKGAPIGVLRFCSLFSYLIEEQCDALVTKEAKQAADIYALDSAAMQELSYICAVVGMSNAMNDL